MQTRICIKYAANRGCVQKLKIGYYLNLKPINGFFDGKHPVESPDDLSYLLFQIYLTTIFGDASIEIRIICCLSPNTRMNTTLRQWLLC